MPHVKPGNLPNTGGRWPIATDDFRSVHWGDLEVGYTNQRQPLDCTELYRSGGVRQCPHFGYVFEGAIRLIYPNTDRRDDIATAGEVYFLPAGDVLINPELTKALELNPVFALQQAMGGMRRAWDKVASADDQGHETQ